MINDSTENRSIDSSFDTLTLRHHLVAAGLMALWSLFTALSYVATYYESSRLRGRDFSWYQESVPILICYVVWVVLTPLMLTLCHRVMFRRERWLPYAALHLAAGFGFGALRAVIANAAINAIFEAHNPLCGLGSSFLGGTTYWVFLLVYSGYTYYRRYREREMRTTQLEGQLARAQVQALRMQLQPHFLFNALNTIASLCYHDAQAANRMISRLGDLLRISLDSLDRQEVTLQQEIDFLGKYLDIEKARFEDRLEVRLDIPEETRRALVPTLILQPIVENAIRHGVGRIARTGRIEVRSERYGTLLRLTVRDNGPGLSEEGDGAASPPRLGIANTTARLEKMYGSSGRIELIDVDANGDGARECEGTGLEVRLSLPFHERPLMPKDVEEGQP